MVISQESRVDYLSTGDFGLDAHFKQSYTLTPNAFGKTDGYKSFHSSRRFYSGQEQRLEV
jgi:hypothetical protein